MLPKGAPVYLQRYGNGAWSTIGRASSTGAAAVAVSAKVGGSVAPYRLSVPALAPYWIDVNTTGCLQMDHRGENYTDEYIRTRLRVTVLAGGEPLDQVDLVPGETEWMNDIRLRGPRTRIGVTDLAYTGAPLAWNVSWVLCNN